MEIEKLKCIQCGKEIEQDKEFEIYFREFCETHCFCEECFKDVYAYATGFNLVDL